MLIVAKSSSEQLTSWPLPLSFKVRAFWRRAGMPLSARSLMILDMAIVRAEEFPPVFVKLHTRSSRALLDIDQGINAQGLGIRLDTGSLVITVHTRTGRPKRVGNIVTERHCEITRAEVLVVKNAGNCWCRSAREQRKDASGRRILRWVLHSIKVVWLVLWLTAAKCGVIVIRLRHPQARTCSSIRLQPTAFEPHRRPLSAATMSTPVQTYIPSKTVDTEYPVS